MEDYTLFLEQITKLNNEIKNHYSGIHIADAERKKTYYENENRKLIEDGIVNIEKYFHTKKRILWILKEPYCDGNNQGGGWSLVDNLNNERATGNNRTSFQTFDKIIYASYCIINNKEYNELYKKISINAISSILREIAYINIQKLPATKISDNNLISKHLNEHFGIIKQQIATIKPDIIINCSKQPIKQIIEEINNKPIYIWSNHPAYRRCSQNKFVNQILSEFHKQQNSL